jgi:hypothetical protein
MQGRNIVRTFFFCIFFAVGAAVLSGSVLCNVLLRYYHGGQLLQAQQLRTSRLKSLIADYNELLAEIEADPNFARRIAPATLGTKADDANVIYPRGSKELQDAARKVLAEGSGRAPVESAVPAWLTRCSRLHWRIALFFAGAALILISFICFGAKEKNNPQL